MEIVFLAGSDGKAGFIDTEFGILNPVVSRFFLFFVCVLALGGQAFSAVPREKFIDERFPLQLRDDAVLQVRLLKPVSAPRRRLPVVFVFGGFQEAARVLDLLKPLLERAPEVMLASFDYPFSAPRTFRFPQSLLLAPEVKRTIQDTLAGIKVLRTELMKRDDVDPDRITVIGASLGAPFALVAAGEDPHLKGVVLVHGFGDVPGTTMAQFLRSWSPKYGSAAYPVAWLLSHLGWWYVDVPAPEDSAAHLRASQSVLMISAESDSFIPKNSIEVLWNSLRASPAQKERIITAGDHLQPGSEALIGKILVRVADWMAKTGLLGEKVIR